MKRKFILSPVSMGILGVAIGLFVFAMKEPFGFVNLFDPGFYRWQYECYVDYQKRKKMEKAHEEGVTTQTFEADEETTTIWGVPEMVNAERPYWG